MACVMQYSLVLFEFQKIVVDSTLGQATQDAHGLEPHFGPLDPNLVSGLAPTWLLFTNVSLRFCALLCVIEGTGGRYCFNTSSDVKISQYLFKANRTSEFLELNSVINLTVFSFVVQIV